MKKDKQQKSLWSKFISSHPDVMVQKRKIKYDIMQVFIVGLVILGVYLAEVNINPPKRDNLDTVYEDVELHLKDKIKTGKYNNNLDSYWESDDKKVGIYFRNNKSLYLNSDIGASETFTIRKYTSSWDKAMIFDDYQVSSKDKLYTDVEVYIY